MSRTIQNFEALAESELRIDALTIAEAGYAALHTGNALRRTLLIEGGELHVNGKTYELTGRRIFFVGVGKCAFTAAETIEEILGERLSGGIVLDVSPVEEHTLARIEMHRGTHPLPSEANVEGARRIVEFLSGRRSDDLVLMVISGGGSALLCLHDAPMTCLDETVLFTELTARGATIQDINTVRKHISRARGGGLAKAAYPAEVVSLIVSDVPGNDVSVVASGPTVLDTSTIADAKAVLEKYDFPAPESLEFIETPKEQKYFERVTNQLFLTSEDALHAMQEEAARRGYTAHIAKKQFTGEARDIGLHITDELRAAPANTALLYAGESTVTISGDRSTPRTGGRNQEMALAALTMVQAGEIVLPFASDGHDNSDHAGAIADERTNEHARARDISAAEYLEAHRSYDFFKTTGDALLTGYTGSNVSDLIVALKK